MVCVAVRVHIVMGTEYESLRVWYFDYQLAKNQEPLCNNRLLPNTKHCRLLFLLCTCLWLKYNCNFSFRYANVKGRGSINWSEVRKVLLSQNAIIWMYLFSGHAFELKSWYSCYKYEWEYCFNVPMCITNVGSICLCSMYTCSSRKYELDAVQCTWVLFTLKINFRFYSVENHFELFHIHEVS